mmetsp:Transcript_25471/g.33268  ORF Transcript_25471/g.33268 Transcript_25471/m.33268 type:complete len:327 (+) Transcript_25471:233-1213(+)
MIYHELTQGLLEDTQPHPTNNSTRSFLLMDSSPEFQAKLLIGCKVGLARACFAEFIGSFVLNWIGSSVSSSLKIEQTEDVKYAGFDSVAGYALAWGFAVMFLSFCLADVSGAHLNPVITLALGMTKNCSLDRAIMYILLQFIGTICGIAFVRVAIGEKLFDGGVPKDLDIVDGGGFLMEFFGTCIWVFAVLCCATYSAKIKDEGWTMRRSAPAALAPVAVGVAVVAATLAAGPYTGGFFNPARALGAAIYTEAAATRGDGFAPLYWIFWVGPVAGAVFTSAVYCLVFGTMQIIFPHNRLECEEYLRCKEEGVPLEKKEEAKDESAV